MSISVDFLKQGSNVMLIPQVCNLFIYFVHQNNNYKNTAAINGLTAYSFYLSAVVYTTDIKVVSAGRIINFWVERLYGQIPLSTTSCYDVIMATPTHSLSYELCYALVALLISYNYYTIPSSFTILSIAYTSY